METLEQIAIKQYERETSCKAWRSPRRIQKIVDLYKKHGVKSIKLVEKTYSTWQNRNGVRPVLIGYTNSTRHGWCISAVYALVN